MERKVCLIRHVIKDDEDDLQGFALGIKQLQGDPWEHVPERHPAGTVVTGVVTNITDFGIFLEIEGGVEGLIHISELSKEKIHNPQEVVKIGDALSAVVLKVNKKERKIGLSLKEMEFVERGNQRNEYIQTQESGAPGTGASCERDKNRHQMQPKFPILWAQVFGRT